MTVALGAGYWLGRGGNARGAPGRGERRADATAKSGGKKLLYYRNPMGLPDTSPTPKKDPMGMDYIAVYEGEERDGAGTVKVSADRIQTLGVRTETVEQARAGTRGAGGRNDRDQRARSVHGGAQV